MSATRTLWLPERFDPRDLGFWRDRRGIQVFISRLLTSARTSDREGWTPVRQQEARAVLGAFEQKRARMEEIGLIECDYKSEPGVKAFHYRLGPDWRARPVRLYRTGDPETFRLWEAMRGRKPGAWGAAEPADPIRDHLNSWLRRMTLDPEAIEQFMAGVEGEDRRRYNQLIIDLTILGDPADRDGECCAYGRFHSFITRMPRGMRKALRIDGRPLGEADIRAAQPLIQAIHAARHARRRPGPAAARPAHTIAAESAPIHLAPDLPLDLIEFFEHYQAGVDFYEWFASKIGMPCATEEQRDLVKRAWAWLVYDEPRWSIPAWRERWEAYRESCPSIASWLERTKRDDYREAARECQRFESRLMIQEVGRDLLEHHPDLPILTIHDAILAPDDGLDVVSETIRRVWGREGVEPALKIKRAA